MTLLDTPYASTVDESEIRSGSYVDWSCALGGAAVAAAMSTILLAFGSGLGLSLLSPWPSERISGTLFGMIMIAWTVFVPVLAFAVGGYFAGRLRRPWQQTVKTEEVAFRDGAHGALVWAASIVVGAILLGTVAAGTAGMTASPATSRLVDDLLRSEQLPSEADATMRDEVQRLLGTTGVALSATDQIYLGGLVARSTGLADAEASQRVATILEQARAAAEAARKAGIVAAFFSAVSLLLGLAVAWFAARKGGEDRDRISKVL